MSSRRTSARNAPPPASSVGDSRQRALRSERAKQPAPKEAPSSKSKSGRGRRGASAATAACDRFDTLLNEDLQRAVFSFVAPAQRYQNAARVCKKWKGLVLHDRSLWASVVVTRRVPNIAKLPPTRKLYYTYEPELRSDDAELANDITLDEYHPNRLSLAGVLPLTPQQFVRIPDASWLETLFVHADWREAGGAFFGEDESINAEFEGALADEGRGFDEYDQFDVEDEDEHDGEDEDEHDCEDEDEHDGEDDDEHDCEDDDEYDGEFGDDGELGVGSYKYTAKGIMRDFRRALRKRRKAFAAFMHEVAALLFHRRGGALARCTSLRALHWPLEWVMPYSDDMADDARAWLETLAQWLRRHGERLAVLDLGVISASSSESDQKFNALHALLDLRKASLPKRLPALAHLPAFDSAGISYEDVKKWPLRFRQAVRTISVNVAEKQWRFGMASTVRKGWQLKHVEALASLFPGLERLRLEADKLDRELFDGILKLPASLKALYLVCASPYGAENRTVYWPPRQPAPYADSSDWQRFSRFVALEELVLCIGCGSDGLNRSGAHLDGALSLALPSRANVLVLDTPSIISSGEQQLGFDHIYHESGDQQFGGLRPLHRALLPSQIEPWHLHALEMPCLEYMYGGLMNWRRGPLLLGPLAQGKGPAAWLAELAEVRQQIKGDGGGGGGGGGGDDDDDDF